MVVTRAHKVQKQPGAHGQYQWQYMESKHVSASSSSAKPPAKDMCTVQYAYLKLITVQLAITIGINAIKQLLQVCMMPCLRTTVWAGGSDWLTPTERGEQQTRAWPCHMLQ